MQIRSTKYVGAGRSTVQSFPLQWVFPAYGVIFQLFNFSVTDWFLVLDRVGPMSGIFTTMQGILLREISVHLNPSLGHVILFERLKSFINAN
jgi:hypothetical protein